MVRVSTPHVTAGAGLAIVGSVATVAGAVAHPAVPAVVGTTSGPLLALIVGAVLTSGGALTFALGFRRDLPEENIVPAHVAFVAKPKAAEDLSDAMARLVPQRPKTKRAPETAADAKIRDISREINRAGVMLATGRLSREAYMEYVEELKRQRGELEARNVTREMAGGGAF